MVNIGEISKPSVSESPVRPKRSTSDSELVVPADDVGSPAKVSTPMHQENRKNKHNKKQQTDLEDTEALDNKLHDDDFYDETGHQQHHGELDVKA